jgi:putative membrane protein
MERSNVCTPYARFDKTQLHLRDELAVDRTVLANERTFLAYVRTALALVLAGVTFIHFSRAMWFSIIGILCIPAGIGVFAIGLRRYRFMKGIIDFVRKRVPPVGIPNQKDTPERQSSRDGE